MKKIFVFGISAALAVGGFSACGGGERSNNLNTTNMNRASFNTSGNGNGGAMTNANAMSNMNSGSISNANGGAAAMSDSDFMMEAARGGMAEVELSQQATTKAQNAEVKKFAQMMIADHTKANAELKTLAGGKNVTLPTELDAMHKAKADELKNLSGAEFDRAYVAAMLADHEKSVRMFQTHSQGGMDAAVKAFAAKNLPTLQMHLESVRGLHNKMNAGGGAAATGGGAANANMSNKANMK